MARKAAAQLDELIGLYVDLRTQRDNAAEQLTQVTKQIQEQMEAAGLESHRTPAGSKVVLVERNNDTLNEETLRKRLGAQMWNKVTTRVLDKRKLDAFIKSGEVSVKDVAMSTTVGQPTSYIRVTR